MIQIASDLVDRALVVDDALLELAQALRPSPVERIDGKIAVSPGTGGQTARRNSRLTRLLDEYAERYGCISFDSSTGFHMPDHYMPSPGHALLSAARWNALTPEQQTKLPPLVPDVVVELRSENERGRASIVAKCERCFAYGVAYVVLLDPFAASIREWGTRPEKFPDLRSVFDL